jgi:[amino group carrier protein]-lysine/ornithine hydrolase
MTVPDDVARDLLRALVSIPSFSGREQALATYLVQAMTRLGLRSYLDAAGNVIGETGRSQAPLVLLLGHLDTVPGTIPVREERGVLYGRGAVDAKGPLATLITAAAALGQQPARIVVAGAVEEETPGSRGARALLDRYQPAAVIVGEPSGWSSVTIGYKGRVDFTFELDRPPSHSASPQEKASDAAIELWSQLTRYLGAPAVDESEFYRPVATVNSIMASAVYARLNVTCRIPPGFDLDALVGFIRAISHDGGLWFDQLLPAVVTDRSAPPVRALVGAIRRLAARPTLKLKTGTSDMNLVARVWRAPAVAYGPGDPSLSHTPHERLSLDEYLRAVAVLTDGLGVLVRDLGTRMVHSGGECDRIPLDSSPVGQVG